MTEPLISADRVEEILRDCLYRPDEMAEGDEVPEGTVIVEGIINTFGFHPQRLESHRGEVRDMLMNLPTQFRQSEDGGWSFLNACQDRNDVQWTGLHRTMDHLVVLGIGLSLADWSLPRDIWSALPGGMPYFVVKDGG